MLGRRLRLLSHLRLWLLLLFLLLLSCDCYGGYSTCAAALQHPTQAPELRVVNVDKC